MKLGTPRAVTPKALEGYLGAGALEGHSFTQSTWALEHLRHSKHNWAFWHSKLLGIWALGNSGTQGTRDILFSRLVIDSLLKRR